jgi:hypothetical protein
VRSAVNYFNRLVTLNSKKPFTVLHLHRLLQLDWHVSVGSPTDEKLQQIAGLFAGKETLHALQELGMPLSNDVVEAVAQSGRLSILQHLLTEQQCPAPYRLSYYAARSGSISMLNWLRAEGWCAFDHDTCAGAARSGHLAALQHVRRESCEWREVYIGCYAASGGSIEAVEWLQQQQGIVLGARAMASAAGAGQLPLCAHLRSTGCDWDAQACIEAAAGGHLYVIRWLREHGCPWGVRNMCIAAARHDNPSILDYVAEQGEVLDAELLTVALNHAGACGQLRAAQWLRQHGAQWPAELGAGATPWTQQWSGAALAWARAEGCTSPCTTIGHSGYLQVQQQLILTVTDTIGIVLLSTAVVCYCSVADLKPRSLLLEILMLIHMLCLQH